MVGWIVGYPFDVVKAKIMITTDRHITIRDAFKAGYKLRAHYTSLRVYHHV